MKQPKVIFFDAVGTLFGVQGTVGEIYSAIAANMGVESSPESLNIAFYQSFKNAPPLAFSGVVNEVRSQKSEVRSSFCNGDDRLASQTFRLKRQGFRPNFFDNLEVVNLEYNWWKAIAQETFNQVGLLEQFTDFDAFFQKLYEHFSTVSPWFVYNDVLSCLKYWQKQGIELGIISNFDSRIYPVLEVLELNNFFNTITISSITGAAKPNEKIFRKALEKHQCEAHQAWHIGDSFKEDYQGAKSVGIKAFLLERNDLKKDSKEFINTLDKLIF